MPTKESLRSFSDPENTLYLVDISSFIFRAFFAIRLLHNRSGEPTNAVYGVATMLARLWDDAHPRYLAAVYDSKEPSFRKEMYEAYKANRSEPPDDLVPQFDRIEQLVDCLRVPSFRQSGVEADDLIAALTRRWCQKSADHRVVIVTGDKDLMQLVNDRVRIWDTMKEKVFGPKEVEEKFGVRSDQIRDYLAMVGDSSDNIPGVPSIGPKSAVQLLKQFGDLKGVLKGAENGEVKGKKGDVLQNHREDAELSADLVQLKDDLKVDISPQKLSFEFEADEDCVALLKELDFHTLVEKWPKSEKLRKEQEKKNQQNDGRFRTVLTEKGLDELLAALKKTGEFAIDLETTSLNPREAEIVGIAISYSEDSGFYIPVDHRGTQVEQLNRERVLKKLKPILENPKIKKVGQNLKYDWSVLKIFGIDLDGIGADTMVAAYVIDPSGRHNFDSLCLKYLNYQTVKYEEVCGKGKDQIGFDQVDIAAATRYAAEDALYTLLLWKKLRPMLEKEKLVEVFARIELPLVKILAEMEAQGISIDVPYLKKLSRKFEKELIELEQAVQKFKKGPINLNSPAQIGQLLFEELKLPAKKKTKTGYSTDARVLESLANLHEVPKILLEYREISKLKGTYVDPLPEMIDRRSQKIHAGFHQTVAATGRLSSSDPNLQNIPIRTDRGQKIRRAFIPTDGNFFLSADYSQIELRILAHMSDDPELIRSFQANEDVHQRTASEIFQVEPEKVDARQRGIAKAINFGLMYGKTPYGLSQELKIPMAEAKEMIQKYFERYGQVKLFLDSLIEQARTKGYVQTLMGRRRYLPDIKSRNPVMRNNAERMAMNTPMQGTAADLIKLAMILLSDALEKEKLASKLIVQVHDELVLDCPEDEVEKARELVTRSMEGAMQLKVPLRVNCAVGKNWQELK